MTFLILALTLVFCLYLIACYKAKTFKPDLGSGVWKGIILATLFAASSGFILDKAYAKEVEWSLIDHTELAEYKVIPNSPQHKFAGAETYHYRFADEQEARELLPAAFPDTVSD
jgi:hypothetical protein